MRLNKLSIVKLFSIILILHFFSIRESIGQRDSLRLAPLVKQSNDLYLGPYAKGIYVSPYELRQFHRDQTIKNIEWVNSFNLIHPKKNDTIPFLIKDNQTIIQKPEDRFNSRTYSYHKDGRIHKMLRGRHINNLFLNADNGFLIQYGHGGELRRLKRNDKTFEWYNVKNNRLDYEFSFDDKDRIKKIKTFGHQMGPGLDYEIEEYFWNENQLVSMHTIRKFKKSKADSSFINITYDSLGLIKTTEYRKGGETNWTTTVFDNTLEVEDNNHIKITISNKGNLVQSLTFDHYDNLIELKTQFSHKRVEVNYRKVKRWKFW